MVGNTVATIPGNITLDTIQFVNDCQKSSRFIVPLIENTSPDAWRGSTPYPHYLATTPYPYDQLINALQSVQPDPFARLSRSGIVEWIDGLTDKAPKGMASEVILYCRRAICLDLPWAGNPDLAGIGVLASYIVEVAFATTFLLAFMYSYLSRRKSVDHEATTRPRLWTALQTSHGLFWDSALLFAIAVCIATQVVMATTTTWYSWVLTSLSSGIVTSVLIVTWPLYMPSCRHRPARWAGLFVVCILEAVAGIRNLVTNYRDHRVWYDPFEYICLGRTAVDLDLRAFFNLSSITSLFLPVYVLATCTGYYLGRRQILVIMSRPRRQGLTSNYPSSTLAKTLRVICLAALGFWHLIGCVLMFAGLLTLVTLRNSATEMAGVSLAESEWGFGQVMALATWLPTILDFFVVWKGQLKSLEYRLPLGVNAQIEDDLERSGASEERIASPTRSKSRVFFGVFRRWLAVY